MERLEVLRPSWRNPIAALRWLARHEAVVLAALLLAALGLYAFIHVAGEVAAGDTKAFDEWAVRAFRKPHDLAVPIGPEWLRDAALDVTAMGGNVILTFAAAAVVGFLALQRKGAAAAFIGASTLTGLLASLALKHVFSRPRPSVVPHLAPTLTSSFPSGHSMMSAVVYLTLGALLARQVSDLPTRAYVLAVAVLITVAVGLSRVYLGVHYPTDVLAGWTAGLAWSMACWLVANGIQRRGEVRSA